MRAEVDDRGNILISAENGSETFILKRYELGVRLANYGVRVNMGFRDIHFMTITPKTKEEK